MPQGVVEQVAEDLCEAVGVNADLAGIREVGAQADPLGGVSITGTLGGRRGDVAGGHRLRRDVDALLLGSGDGGRVFGETLQAAC